MPAGSKSDTLDVIIRVKDAATKNLKKVDQGLQKIQNRLRSLPRAVFNLKTAFAGLGLTLLARQFTQAASTAEQYQTRLNVLLGSAKEGNRLFQEMADYAGKVSFRYEEIMGAATNLAGVMRGGVDEVKEWMPLIGDLAAATGLSIQETTGQIIRMYSAGAASADMFRERGVLAMLGFQAGVSYSAEETRKRLLAAWKDPASQFRGAAGELGKTWEGLLSMLSDRWFQFRNMVMEAGLFDYLKALVSTFLDFLARLKKEGRLDDYAKRMAKGVLRAINVIIKGGAVALETITLMKRGFEGIKFVLNAIVLVYAKMLEKITGGLAKLAGLVGQKGLAGRLQGISEGFRAIGEVSVQEMSKSEKKMAELAKKQGDYWKGVSKFIEDVKQKAEELGKVQEKEERRIKLKPPVDLKKLEAEQKSYVSRLSETTKTALLVLENAYKNGTIALKDYFDERKALISRQYEAEIKLAEKLAEQEADPAKKIALQDKVFKLRAEFNRALIALEQERFEKTKELDEKELDRKKILESLKLRIATDFAGTLQAQFQRELAEMDQRHQEEIKRLQELNAKKEEIEEAYRLQKHEKDKLMLDQERRLNEYRLQLASDTARGMSDIFNEVYELSGQKRKEFFYLSKAAALAEAIINTSQAITKAMAQGGIWGIAQAAVIGAKGAIQIAKISSQTLGSGGLVLGKSPSATADDKLVAATSGEFMQPVDAVKHYGLGVMEAIRQKAIPKSILSEFSVPGWSRPRFAFATGGAVTGATVPAGQGVTVEASIFNLQDPREFERQLASARGKNALINFMGQNRQTIRRILRG